MLSLPTCFLLNIELIRMKVLPLLFLLLTLLGTSPAIMAKKSGIIELDNIIAVVNDDVITRVELDNRLQLVKKQLGARTKLPDDSILRKQVLERMIMEKIQLQIAKRSGIRVDDETINRVIENIAKENKLSMEQFQKVLNRDGMAFAGFRQNIKNELLINELRKRQVKNKITVSEQEVNNYLANMAQMKNHGEEYRLSHILIATPEAATPLQIQKARRRAEALRKRILDGEDFTRLAIGNSDGPQALKGGDLGWRTAGQMPTFFSHIIPDMKVGDVSQPLRSASGFHIIKLVDKRSPEQSHEVQQTLARHILIRPNQVVSNDDARKQLQALRARILAGEDFGQLARSHSADTASAAEGGSLGWTNPGTMVPKFEEEMDKLKPGEISQPFRTQFGWHIVQVVSRRSHDDSKQYRRNQARMVIGKRKAEEATQNWLRRIRSEAYVDYRFNQ
ncbi:Periplasmic chaperone and peptidyl-prolyl cis-trans isomerase of outer membrane proteins SurA [hydrothermal vent metagenome]|uniref:Periplasmic chaperone and peptidyl-prolyl cis-trans isomerase of outer membrane proteins SurA n=1 Tax=hydrothermal vent metagenome TaxID=652676 RepID=A0A3B1BT19_9ZZZZ